jgi:hypothetical protein
MMQVISPAPRDAGPSRFVPATFVIDRIPITKNELK